MLEEERTARIEEVVLPVLQDHALELVDLEWRGVRPRGILRVFVDKPGGVGIKDCERVSRELGDVLDAASVIDTGYDLEVSSPGLERPLRKDRELRWAIGKRVRCWLAGGADVAGRLAEVEPDRLLIDRDDGEHVALERAAVTKARLEAELPWRRKV